MLCEAASKASGRQWLLLAESTRSRASSEAAVRVGRRPMSASQGGDRTLSNRSCHPFSRTSHPKPVAWRRHLPSESQARAGWCCTGLLQIRAVRQARWRECEPRLGLQRSSPCTLRSQAHPLHGSTQRTLLYLGSRRLRDIDWTSDGAQYQSARCQPEIATAGGSRGSSDRQHSAPGRMHASRLRQVDI